MAGQKIIEKARKEGRTLLTEIEAKELLKGAGINVVETKLAATKEQAVATAQKLGFPVALKIASADVVHKSDAGGVKLGLKTAAQVGKAYDDIMKSIKKAFPNAKIEGVSVQTMAKPGVEVIIGMSKDAQFGPVLMFGLGGVLVEILKDVSFRIVPLLKRDAKEMVRDIKGFPLLQGYRGSEPVDVENMENMLLKVSEFVEKTPEVKELDLNPIFAYKDGAIAVDARVILEKAA
ncbi:MAG: acetate--CoA ligase family protein [Dehalococcoidales bacterium]|nr:acetate--CoA ligase family protein [Dehalococcoidales bacterium]